MRMPPRAVGTDSAAGVNLGAELARAREGSSSALGRLMAWVEPRLRRLAGRESARRYGAGVTRSDLVQHALQQATADFSRCRCKEVGGFARWVEVVGIARWKQLRRNARRRKRGLDRQVQVGRSASRAFEPADPAARSPSEAARQLEMSDAIGAAVERLSPELREVVVLFYRDGLSQGEIAKRLGRDRGTIERRFKKAKQSLRISLRDFDDRP